MIFESTHLVFKRATPVRFSENNPPDWLTGRAYPPDSTMANSRFFEDYDCTLKVGESVNTDFQKITRIE